jgi:hypothetical protein
MQFVGNAFGVDHGRVESRGVEKMAACVEDVHGNVEETELWHAAPAALNSRR